MIINIDEELIKNIKEYCDLNKKDFDNELNKIIKIGFSITKYGYSPFQKMKEQSNLKDNDIKKTEIIEKKEEITKINIEEEIKENINSEKPKKRVRKIKTK